MPIDVTKEEIWQAAKTLAQEEKIPTIMNIRSKLGGGSPRVIARHLANWKEESMKADENIFYTDRELWELKRESLEQEQIELMEEIDGLDAELQRARDEAAENTEALRAERKAHGSIKSHGERWREQLDEAQASVEKLTAENQTFRMEIAALKEQAALTEDLKIQVEKLQGALTDLPEKKESKTPTGQKNATASKNAKPTPRKPAPAKKPEIKKPAIKETEKTFPPTFWAAQKIRNEMQ